MRLASERAGAGQVLVVDNATVSIRVEGTLETTLGGLSRGLGLLRLGYIGVIGVDIIPFALLALCLSIQTDQSDDIRTREPRALTVIGFSFGTTLVEIELLTVI